ncbi:heavy metal-associated domain-containing protein [Proteiniclasticum sp. QWL-01]|uniref:heavy-metal-associated domain-containing protein n=1 Tax=Proteiniclasticum sp. QWL-01 TaxID=3036945 RepID=UPI0024103766|nr:heavy metal-associated domain-containing protein [Proteiniclasticum sp. QWL-01]WFF71660.1 heavy metal-associated domain-containing protein [Proteiniclasticum sp. QWL-01]
MKVRIEGMSCSGCSARVEKAMKALAGIKEVRVDLADHSATYAGEVSEAAVREAIEDIGYEVKGFEA